MSITGMLSMAGLFIFAMIIPAFAPVSKWAAMGAVTAVNLLIASVIIILVASSYRRHKNYASMEMY